MKDFSWALIGSNRIRAPKRLPRANKVHWYDT